jgi:hypothetical protein
VSRAGLLIPNRNWPHSGRSNRAQPSVSSANSSSSDSQRTFASGSSWVSGQPSSVAIGAGIAITVGERVTLGRISGRIRSASSEAAAYCAHAVEAGTHTSGGSPPPASCQPVASAAATSAASRASTTT